jgi:hypothetical protein
MLSLAVPRIGRAGTDPLQGSDETAPQPYDASGDVPPSAAEDEHRDDLARISRVATMLRAQALAIALDGDDASGWRASIIAAADEPRADDRTVGHGSTQAEAAEDAWNRHAAPRD